MLGPIILDLARIFVPIVKEALAAHKASGATTDLTEDELIAAVTEKIRVNADKYLLEGEEWRKSKTRDGQ
jgi:hypothetical protein